MLNVASAAAAREVDEGHRLLCAGRLIEAGETFRRVLETAPTFVPALVGLAIAADAVANPALAMRAAEDALRVEPNNAKALLALARALRVLNQPLRAAEVFERMAAAAPDSVDAVVGLAQSRQLAGELEAARVLFRRAAEMRPDHPVTVGAYLYHLHYLPGISPEEIFGEYRRMLGDVKVPRRAYANVAEPERVLKVGYVSPDFRTHSVARFIEPLLAHHDRSQVTVVCYNNFRLTDATAARLRGLAPVWRDVGWLSDEALEAQVVADGIDILVDLAGHSGDGRLTCFARKPAPVQVTWLGYPNTTGLRAVDYRITDALADPPGAEALHTEKLLRVAPPFLCFQPEREMPAVGGLPAREKGYVTFGSFNNVAKVNGELVGCWAEILRRVPGSRLLIKSPPLTEPAMQERVRGMFAARGIGADRIEVVGYLQEVAGHLGAYNRVDIGLDTFPYHGTTTTCEALAMGVPVVTRAGAAHVSRVGVSLLTAVGHPEWVARDAEDYVRIAAELAGDVERLARVRAGLRGELLASALTDGAGFARRVEAGYREIWRAWCAGQGEKR
jgi:predicted O-linked N-acetylglucosamine transferase (SPINDLY family)